VRSWPGTLGPFGSRAYLGIVGELAQVFSAQHQHAGEVTACQRRRDLCSLSLSTTHLASRHEWSEVSRPG
jgi:hypothetical protein